MRLNLFGGMPIQFLVEHHETRTRVHVVRQPSRWRESVRRIDPLLAAALVVLAGLVVHTVSPMAFGVTKTSDTQIQFDVEQSIAMAPGLTKGDTSVKMPDIVVPGQVMDAESDGWQISSNWALGYDVMIRSATDPALKGSNATDGDGSSDYFKDYTLGGCPCSWDTSSFTKGVFGYSAYVTATSGTPQDTAKWGTSSSHKWRGFDDTPYTLFETGGMGAFDLVLYFRSTIPEDASQKAGSYRANVYLQIAPSA